MTTTSEGLRRPSRLDEAPKSDRPRASAVRLSRGDRLSAILMIGLPLLFDLALIWLPVFMSAGYSLTDWDGVGSVFQAPMVGFENYQDIATDNPYFWRAVRNNVLWIIVFVCVATPFGMLLAVILNRNLKGSRFFESAFFLPVVLSLALIGFIWTLIYAPQQGLLNNVIGRSSPEEAISWLGNSDINIFAVLVAASWRQAGYVMVLYLAGLKGVDPSLLEAAAIDGANQWKTFWYVVFPVLKPINVVILVVTLIESLRAFDIAYIINRGTNGLELLSTLITTNVGSAANRIGYGSALAVVLLVISLVPIGSYLYMTFMKEAR